MITMIELNRRNTETAEQAIKDMYSKIEEQQTRINGLNATMSTMMDRMNQLEQMVHLQKIQSTGTGASVK